MDEITEILIKILDHTDGWVIVVVFALYVGYRVYSTYEQGRALKILDKTIASLLRNIERNTSELASKIDRLVSMWG